jgi:hypothetical protein
MVLLDTPLHVDAVTDDSKLPWHKYLEGEQSKNTHPYNPPASLSLALDNMKVVTELMAGLCNIINNNTKFNSPLEVESVTSGVSRNFVRGEGSVFNKFS